jgi:hypothetical protein
LSCKAVLHNECLGTQRQTQPEKHNKKKHLIAQEHIRSKHLSQPLVALKSIQIKPDPFGLGLHFLATLGRIERSWLLVEQKHVPVRRSAGRRSGRDPVGHSGFS